MTVHLSPRLQRIADYVPQGSTVWDVGTDHAYIPIYLLQSGISARAYASDLREGPLQNARRDAELSGVAEQLTLRRCDGLSASSGEEADTLILAGMGGETILNILAAAPWAKEKRCILQPQTKFTELRRYLAQSGQCIRDASLAYDTGRIYLIWLVEPGQMDPECVIDRALLEKRDPLLAPYTEDRIKRLRKQLSGLERAAARDDALLGQLRSELEELTKIHREVKSWLG